MQAQAAQNALFCHYAHLEMIVYDQEDQLQSQLLIFQVFLSCHLPLLPHILNSAILTLSGIRIRIPKMLTLGHTRGDFDGPAQIAQILGGVDLL